MTQLFGWCVAQVNAAICDRSALVHYIDSSNADKLPYTLMNGIREFMSDEFQRNWAVVLDQVRAI